MTKIEAGTSPKFLTRWRLLDSPGEEATMYSPDHHAAVHSCAEAGCDTDADGNPMNVVIEFLYEDGAFVEISQLRNDIMGFGPYPVPKYVQGVYDSPFGPEWPVRRYRTLGDFLLKLEDRYVRRVLGIMDEIWSSLTVGERERVAVTRLYHQRTLKRFT